MEKIALVIGHNSRSMGGFSDELGKTEFDYWKKVANRIKEIIPNRVDIYERRKKSCYTEEMAEVIEKLNSKKYAYILELHFNCHDEDGPNGVEYLCHKKSKRGKAVGDAFLMRIVERFKTRARMKWYSKKWKERNQKTGKVIHKKETYSLEGTIFVSNDGQRGGFGICHTKAPYVLLEPFFGTTPNDAKKFEDIEKVSQAFASFIEEVE